MPYAVLEDAYATLDEIEQKEVVDFVLYLVSRKQKNQETRKEIDFSFVDNMFGTLTDEESDEMRKYSHLHFNAILVTNNTKHLSKITGIQLENWAK